MKLWVGTYHDDDSASGTCQLWGTSERKVRKALATVAESAPVNYAVYSVKQIEVPTTRDALAQFLNRWADSAGGA
jgi:hypothetical protein